MSGFQKVENSNSAGVQETPSTSRSFTMKTRIEHDDSSPSARIEVR